LHPGDRHLNPANEEPAMPTWRFEVGDKTYNFCPEKDFTITDWERMEDAFGEDFGGWFSFQRLMTKGNAKAARCFIWGARRKAGESTPDDPRQVRVPADFQMGTWWNEMELVPSAKEEEDPDPLESEEESSSNPDGSDPSAE
jgi:hypothetical protein